MSPTAEAPRALQDALCSAIYVGVPRRWIAAVDLAFRPTLLPLGKLFRV